ncbi:unnamed protein product [Protopolystoma xenopodis]|uniref:Uncharacterized protein n=1 Tax=Protopolystoma xenopodis TaxID=117903 RepID=A0A3S4ZUU3_9PLAT|nr:unnamed protein product [Protopolystoma xenopodis]
MGKPREAVLGRVLMHQIRAITPAQLRLGLAGQAYSAAVLRAIGHLAAEECRPAPGDQKLPDLEACLVEHISTLIFRVGSFEHSGLFLLTTPEGSIYYYPKNCPI